MTPPTTQTMPQVTREALESMVIREFERLCPRKPSYLEAEQAVRLALAAAVAEVHALEALCLYYANTPCPCGNPMLCSRPMHDEEA